MEAKRVEQIMIPLDRYPFLRDRHTLKDAIRAFLTCDIVVGEQKSLPRVVLILNDRNELAGLVRRRDIMRGLEPDFMVAKPSSQRAALYNVRVDANLPELFSDGFAKGMRERSKRLVTEVMMPVARTIRHDDHIVKAICELVDHNLSLLPVMNGARVIGVVRSVDVFRELADIILEPRDPARPCPVILEEER